MSSNQVFVIQNQHQQYLDKNKSWYSGKDSSRLFKAKYHDEALNTLLEVNAKDILLRGIILEVEEDEKKRPIVEVSPEAIAMDIKEPIFEEETAETAETAEGADQETNSEDASNLEVRE